MGQIPKVTNKHYKDIRQHIRSGDILFCSGNSLFSTLIQKATNSIWSHVAFVLRVEEIDRVMVLESVESIGVRTIPLSNYIRDYNATGAGYAGQVMLARHEDVQEKNISQLSRKAIDFLGYPYRTEEIVHIATRITMHTLGFPDAPRDSESQRAFICSEYAQACFKSIGISFNYNPLGFISPADFYRSPKVKPICYIQTETLHNTPIPLHRVLHKRFA